MQQGKKNVAVLFGGRSVEHEISIITGLQLMRAMDITRYQPIPVYIAPNGRWYTGDELFDRPFYKKGPAALDRLTEVTLLPLPGQPGLRILRRTRLHKLRGVFSERREYIPVDVYFPSFHGDYGEDGCVQGLLEMADAAYTSSGVISSSLAMNKYLCKSVLRDHGIPTLPAALVDKFEAIRDLATAREAIFAAPGINGYPLFVKPNHLGSSIGIGRALDEAMLHSALARVFLHDTQAIIEPFLADMFEINVSVLDGVEPRASVVEIPISQSGTLSYEEKYLTGQGQKKAGGTSGGMANLTRAIDPAHLSQETKNLVRNFALKAFKVLGCAGVVRFDFMCDKRTGRVYFNELNPQPGSFSFYLWEKSQPPLLYTEELTAVIERALERRKQRAAVERNLGFKAL